ncbi:MAG: hypothetical protein D6705_16835 [Deltaproteobacteria bacterium]|nr:MAG: hypothetical protein D6705_16835 [Deltaproteobacteria bacterium]
MLLHGLLTFLTIRALATTTSGIGFDPEHPPPELEPWTDLDPPIDVVRSERTDLAVLVRRLDGHRATFKVGLVVEGEIFDGDLVAAHCIDTLWPGHVHVVLGQGPTVRDGYDWLAFGSKSRLLFLGSVVTPFAKDAATYVRRLLAGETPSPARRVRADRLRDPRSDPNIARLPLWALDRPPAGVLDAWTPERCRAAVSRGVAAGTVKVAVSAGGREGWDAFEPLASQQDRSLPSSAPTWSGPAVMVTSWSGADIEGFSVVAPLPSDGHLAVAMVRTLTVAAQTQEGTVYTILRKQLGATYAPIVERNRGRVYVAATTPPDQQSIAARRVLSRLRDPSGVREDAVGVVESLRRARWNDAETLRRNPYRVFDPTIVTLGDRNETGSIDADGVARGIAEAFAEPIVVFVEPRIDGRALADACMFASNLDQGEVWVVELPNGGSKRHTCRRQ